MKPTLKFIKNIVIILIMSFMMPYHFFGQEDIPFSPGTDVLETANTYGVGDAAFDLTITPGGLGIGNIVIWTNVDATTLNGSGLKMVVGGEDPFVSPDLEVTVDGTAEILHVVPDPTVTLTTIVEDSYTIFLEFESGGDTSEIEVIIPVRKPVSAAFVLDRSGSMGNPPHDGVGTITRMDILQTAANLFVNKLDAFKVPGDSVALTYFETTVDTPPPGFGASFTDIDGNASNFTNEIIALTPGGWTAMGDGLLSGKNKLSTTAAHSRQLIFLFTDGEQNRGDEVVDGGPDIGEETDSGESLNNSDDSIHIITIATGAAAMGAPASLLEEIATKNTPTGATARFFLLQEEVNAGGDGSDFNTTTGIANFFDAGFENMLEGNSPQTVGVENGRVPRVIDSTSGSSTSAPVHNFEINDNIDKILFELITPDQEPFFTVEKDGVSVTGSCNDESAIKYIFGPNNGTNSLLGIIDLKKYAGCAALPQTSKGTWTVRVRSGTGGGKPYQIKAQVDDHRLDYDYNIEADDFKVGDQLRIFTDLSYRKKPIQDANVSVLVFKPGEDLGDLLARAQVKLDVNDSVDVGSIGYEKLLALLEQNPDLIDSLNLGENVVNLSHSGDGKYEGTFSDTDVSGVYQTIAQISASNDSIGKINRLTRRTVYLRFGDPDPDPNVSPQQVTQIGDNKFQLQYAPKYKVGDKQRFVGPGFANGISIKGNDVANVNTVDNGDGSYTITFDAINGNNDPDISISISDVKVYKGSALGFGKSQDCNTLCEVQNWLEDTFGIPGWLAFIIALLILLILWILNKKFKKPKK
ncbi:vWA domain-containing protein [Aquimarina algiphila]|uniref:vWA domain-containing protein n=1 Tax=Aquimarina algiphila TaxID=2047982 RepID=UPI00248FEAAD|nr:vWA domain-containing protein [Aquimarina algiphila]